MSSFCHCPEPHPEQAGTLEVNDLYSSSDQTHLESNTGDRSMGNQRSEIPTITRCDCDDKDGGSDHDEDEDLDEIRDAGYEDGNRGDCSEGEDEEEVDEHPYEEVIFPADQVIFKLGDLRCLVPRK